ncbi:MAG: hypothetical protein ACWIPH_07085, partial [Ostreibacterium sp.]
ARSQAKWLAHFLSEKLHQDVPVKAVLSIPGWYIKREQKQTPQNILLTNGKAMDFLLTVTSESECLSETLLYSIANIIEEGCKNKETLSFKESRKN